MSASQFLDMQGPARKRMRKGTKSCIECRRRKIRCTYDSDHPNVCNECRSRGSECVDQERGSSGPKVTGPLTSEQSYSLRERVAQLETVVKQILQQMEQTTPSTSASSNHHGYFKDTHTQRSKSLDDDHISNSVQPTPVVPVQSALAVITNESVEDISITEGPRIENAPVLQILNNNVISSTEGAATRSQKDAARLAISPKAIAVRDELAKLVPPRADLLRIRDMAVDWWSIWIHMFPELPDKDRSVLVGERDCFEIPQSPGDVAKFLLCNLLCLDQLPAGFDCKSFEMPIVPSEYAERCVNAIERLIVNDEDLCGTLSSLEAILLLSKWYSNIGRPRKSWLVARRAVELAQLAGFHISTAKDPVPGDMLYERRLKLWTMLGLNERYLCILLGLPYAIQDRLYRPQVERRLRTEPVNMEICCLQLSLMMGPIIDRNQEDPAKMSIADTLKLEQEMQNHARKLPDHFWQQHPPDLKLTEVENIERLLVGFMFHYLRAMLHLPFMLQSHNDHRYRFSHKAALESSRNALLAYNRLRSEGMVSPYVCRVIDFQAFSVAMLLIINAIGYSEDAPNYNPVQDEKDWALVNATTEVLRHAESEPSGTVAQQSLLILEAICKNRDNNDCPPNVSCKVTVPYFGSVTVTPRHNALKSRNARTSSHKTAQNQHQHQHQQPQPHPQQHRSNHYRQQLTPSNSSLASQHASSSSSSTAGTTSSGQPSPFHLYTTPQSVIDFSNVSISNCLDQSSQQQQHQQQQYQEARENLATTSSIWDDSRVQLENILALPNAGYLNNESNATYTGGFIDSSNSDESLGLWRNMNLDLDLDQGWNLDWLGAGIIP